KGFQCDIDEAAISASGEGNNGLNSRIFLDDVLHVFHRFVHCREGGILWSLNSSGDRACVLLGKEAFGDLYDDSDVQKNCKEENCERETGVIENPMQGAAVKGEDP